MAISQAVRAHAAWVTVNGQKFLLKSGSATQTAAKKSSTFSGDLPMDLPGAMALFTTLGENSTTISVMSGNGEVTLLEGEIDNVQFGFIEGVINFSGRDKSAKLHATKSSEKFINQKNSDVVKTLAQRVGLSADVDESKLNAGKMVQIDWTKLTDGLSFASIIHKIAEMEGCRWWVSKGTLHFKNSDSDAAAYPIVYVPGPTKSADFLKLVISRNVQAGKTVKVKVSSWNTRKKQAFIATSTVEGVGGTTEYNYHVPGLTQDHAFQHAKSKAFEHCKHEFHLTVDCAGDVNIDVSMKLRLRGTIYFDQDYDMENVVHHFGMGGHRMCITSKGPKKGRSAT